VLIEKFDQELNFQPRLAGKPYKSCYGPKGKKTRFSRAESSL